MGSWKNIAALLNAKTKEGGLFVRPTEGLLFLLSVGMEVTFVPPILRFPRSSRVARIEQPHPGKYMVYFEDILTRNDAEKLEGHFCLVREEDLPQGYDETMGNDLLGYQVIDESLGFVGTVIRIEENPAHPLLVVEREGEIRPEGPGSAEVLIPLVDAFIVALDEKDHRIVVSLPEGLLDL